MKIYLKEYNFGEDFSKKFFELIAGLDKNEEKEIIFENKDYYFSGEKSIQEVMYISNTCSEEEMTPPIRKIGIYLKETNNITLNGNGARLWYKDRMTEFVLENCSNVTVKNFIVDFIEPSVYEFEVKKKTMFSIDIKPSLDSKYEIVNGKLHFLEDIGTNIVVQKRDDKQKFTNRIASMSWTGKNVFKGQKGAKKLENGLVRIRLPFHSFKTGLRYQVANILRDGAGTFVTSCCDVVLENNIYHYMHGMGILSQLTTNITISKCDFVPNYERDRTTAAFADIIHCNMCSGTVKMLNCNCDGSRDDIVNVHGNHFLLSKIDGNKIEVKFCHPQTYGFLAFDKGDEVEFIDPKTLVPIEKNAVKSAKMLDLRTTEITLEKDPSVQVGMVVENSTKTPSLLVDGVNAIHIPTRGILVSTQKPVVIKNCNFENMYMTNVLVSDDATSWYESGYVRDVLIENNKFIGCFAQSIDIFPEAHTCTTKPIVHKNVRVVNNEFILSRNGNVARVKRVDGFSFKNNKISGEKPKFSIIDSENVKIEL